jgi:hypothetical protein
MNEPQEKTPEKEREELFILVDWSGPHTFEKASQLHEHNDYGLYQVYGRHLVYGNGVLLYIGCAPDRTLGIRIAERGNCYNDQPFEFHVGRLIGRTPDNETWGQHIKLAEQLLINVHAPFLNVQHNREDLGPELNHVHVFNYRQYRSLMPEVSGARWGTRFDHIAYDQYYSNKDFGQPT